MKQKRKAYPKFSTEDLGIRMLQALINDYRTTYEKCDAFNELYACLEKRDIKALRNVVPRELGLVDPDQFKWHTQVYSFFKKFRFTNDLYTDQELTDLTVGKYLGCQERLGSLPVCRHSTRTVVRRARVIIKDILGSIPDLDEIMAGVRFGQKSSIGCALNKAYLDFKCHSDAPCTGSQGGVKLFKEYLLQDKILAGIFSDRVSRLQAADSEQLNIRSLRLVLVPKSYKSLRAITPLPLVDLFMTFGIGAVVEDRLKGVGLNISTLQKRHRRLVRDASVRRHLVTADLSSASDSITSRLLMMLFPRPWYTLLKTLFFRTIEIQGKFYFTESVLPMGNGFTFPIETLVFYALLRALCDLTGINGDAVSVYGDDLIYPSRLHRYVSKVFPDLGLILNLDKTFNRFPFRESCGADFYRGVDVRPCFYPDSPPNLSRYRFHAHLYKCHNSLCERWHSAEIPQTLRLIIEMLRSSGSDVYYVPPSFPDYSGIKSSVPPGTVKLEMKDGCQRATFSHLLEMPRKIRVVKGTAIYYWNSLRSMTQESRIGLSNPRPFRLDMPGAEPIDWGSGFTESVISQIIWRKLPWLRGQPKPKRDRKYACTWSRDGITINTNQTTITDWV